MGIMVIMNVGVLMDMMIKIMSSVDSIMVYNWKVCGMWLLRMLMLLEKWFMI